MTPFAPLTDDGVVGIGTTAPDPAYKLSVDGSIRADEIVVESGWSDFVFDRDYDLLPLEAEETFIQENGHLPDVPSAEEVEADGVTVGETQAILLQKIEELTLHLIAQEKRIQELEAKLGDR